MTFSFPPRERGEGGPPEGRWEGRGPRRNSFNENDALSQTPPPPSYARSRELRMVPLPRYRGGGRNRFSFSRCGFLIRTRAMSTPVPKTPPHPRPLSDDPGSGGPEPSRSDAARKPRKPKTNERKKRKEAERRKAQFSSRACKARRASSGTRSPFGVPLRLSPRGLLIPKAQLKPGFLRLGGSLRAYGPPTGASLARFSTGVTRARLSQSSEHLTRRSYCRQADAQAARMRE